jgi:phage tail-like protein
MSDTSYYPPPAFAFSVAIVPGSPPAPQTAIDGAFQEVSGIESHVEVEELKEGGVNSFVHQLPGATKHGNLVLKRGYVTQSSALAQWALQTVGSSLGDPIQTQTLNVNLLDSAGQPVVTWTFQNAWPVKWEAGSLDAEKNQLLTETLEIAYTTVTRQLNQGSGASG